MQLDALAAVSRLQTNVPMSSLQVGSQPQVEAGGFTQKLQQCSFHLRQLQGSLVANVPHRLQQQWRHKWQSPHLPQGLLSLLASVGSKANTVPELLYRFVEHPLPERCLNLVRLQAFSGVPDDTLRHSGRHGKMP